MGSNQFSHLFKQEEKEDDTDTNKMTNEELADEVIKTFRLKKISKDGKIVTAAQEAKLN